MNKQGTAWTPDDDKTLTEMWAAGDTIADCALAVHRSYQATIAHAHVLLLPKRQSGRKKYQGGPITATWTKADTDLLFALAAKGVSLTALAVKFRRSRESIQRKLDKPRRVMLDPRPCLTCRKKFRPEAKVLFMCPACRYAASEANQYTPGAGGRWRMAGRVSI